MYFLISTMNERFDCNKSNLKPEYCIVVNQGKNTNKYCQNKYAGVVYLDSFGLSKSRNSGLNYYCQHQLKGPIIICDDDVIYFERFSLDLLSNRLQLKKGVNACQIKCPDGSDFKNYNTKVKKVTCLTDIFGISSVELVINDSELINTVRFNEDFGLGSVNEFGGEEALFLRDWIGLGGVVFRVPIYLGVHPRESTGTKVHEKGYWSTRKNLFKELSPKFWLFFYLAFKVKKKVNQFSNWRRHFI